MTNQKENIVFDSKIGWYFETITFRPIHATEAEVMLHNRGTRKLYVKLRGIKSPKVLLDVLYGFDDFHVIERETGTPFSETERYLCRFWVDEDRYETIIDEYEAYEADTAPSSPDDVANRAASEK